MGNKKRLRKVTEAFALSQMSTELNLDTQYWKITESIALSVLSSHVSERLALVTHEPTIAHMHNFSVHLYIHSELVLILRLEIPQFSGQMTDF